MDWDDDFITASQEAALQALERRSGGGGGGSALTPQLAAVQCERPPSAPPAPAAADIQAASHPMPIVRRRKLPAILSDAPPAGGSSGTAAAAGASAGAAPGDDNLPPARFAGRLCYAHTGNEVDQLCQQLLQSGVAAVGLDIEWRVLYQTGVPPRPVALIQLCFSSQQAFGGAGGTTGAAGSTSSGGSRGNGSPRADSRPSAPSCPQQQQQQQQAGRYTCLLLHICHSGITPHLRQLLTCPGVLKVGVGIHGDSLKIQRDFGIEMQGIVCLSEYANARLVAPPPGVSPAAAPAPAAASASAAAGLAAAPVAGPATGSAAAGQPGSGSIPSVAFPQKWSLAGLVSLLLRLRLEKSQSVRCSNWEARPPLSGEQQAYAATDAWASLRVYEVLAKLPVVAPPPPPAAPVGAALPPGLEAAGAPGMPSAAADWVPACAHLRHVQPAKMAVYQALVHQGLTVQAIAAQRRIQEDSVQGNMAAAIAAGLGYSWSCLGVPTHVLHQVAGVCSQLLERPLACQPPQPSEQLPEQQQQRQQQQPPKQQQQQQVGAKRPPPCSPGSLAAVTAAETAEARPAAAGAAAAPAAAGDEPVDLLDVLLAAGHKLRELKDTHFEEVSYGWLRLSLAHLGRCNPGPWD